MVYQMLAALILNMNLTLFFFQMPYRVLDLGGTQEIVGMLSMIHSVIYVASTAILGRKIPDAKKVGRNLTCVLLMLIGIYIATCLSGHYAVLFPLVALHAVCVGMFWPMFWSGFAVSRGKSVEMSTSVILINGLGALSPALGGYLYPILNRYLMCVSAAALITLLVFRRPLMILDRGMIQRNENSDVSTFLIRKKIPAYAKPCSLSSYQTATLLVVIWGIMFAAGYMEGVFRSSAGIYLLHHGYGSDVWGTLQSVKFLCTTGTVILYRFFREEIAVLFRMKQKWILWGAILGAGALLMMGVSRTGFLYVGMALLGSAYGGLTFSCMYAGSKIVRNYGLNIGGLSECVLGLGILIGSLISGFSQNNPFFMLIVFGGILIVLPLFIKRENDDKEKA